MASTGIAGRWHEVGQLATGRDGHTATLLDGPACRSSASPAPTYCGRVLVAGGAAATQESELYDPAAATWTEGPALITARTDGAATLLADGRVLVAGGSDGSGNALASTEIYLPPGPGQSAVWTPGPPMIQARTGQRAALLPDGRVLEIGGRDLSGRPLASVEVFDPSTPDQGWQAAPPMTTPRADDALAVLGDGQVLVTGGEDATGQPLASAEILTLPASGAPGGVAWAPVPAMGSARAGHTATVLDGPPCRPANGAPPPWCGQVLVAGSGTAEIFDPATSSWHPTPAMEASRRDHGATLLVDGRVLVQGGSDPAGNALSSAEIYDPTAGTWAATGSLLSARRSATTTALGDGSVLVTGGSAGGTALRSAEVFDPSAAVQPPTVTNVAPSGGAVGGGTSLVLTGAGFTGATGVSFGATPATQVSVDSDNRIEVVSPPAAGPVAVDVTVTTPVQTSITTNVARFQYALAPSVTAVIPDAGAVSGGTHVQITGTDIGFPDTTVHFGATASTSVIVISDTELDAVSPPHGPGSVDVTATTPAGTSIPIVVDRFTYGDGTWAPAPPVPVAAYKSTSTLLKDGTVLVAGGTTDFDPSDGVTPLRTATIYNPATGTWRPTGSLDIGRFDHTATLLDDGEVLVTGGEGIDPSAQFATDTPIGSDATLTRGRLPFQVGAPPPGPGPTLRLSATSDPPLSSIVTPGTLITYTFAYFNTGEAGATGVVTDQLPPQLLFASVSNGGSFDPASGQVAVPLTHPVPPGTTATDPAGIITVTAVVRAAQPSDGGQLVNAANLDGRASNPVAIEEQVTPVTGAAARVSVSAAPPFGATVSPGTVVTHRLTYFNPGTADQANFVVTDALDPNDETFVSASDNGTFDPKTNLVTFPPVTVPHGTTADDPLASARTFTVTVSIGPRAPTALDTAEIYNPAMGTWRLTAGKMAVARLAQTATRLADDQVLITGGAASDGRDDGISSSELYDPASDTFLPTGSLASTCASAATVLCGRSDHTATLLPDGRVLVAGGLGQGPADALKSTTQLSDAPQIDGTPGGGTGPLVGPHQSGPAIGVSGSATPAPGSVVRPGDLITYSFAVFNSGGASATTTLSSTLLPREVAFVSARDSTEQALSLVPDPNSRVLTFPPLTVSASTTPAQPAAVITVTVRVLMDYPTSPPTPIADHTQTNFGIHGAGTASSLSHTIVTGSEPGVALGVATVSEAPGSLVAPGSPLTLTLDYYNGGVSSASGAVVTDHLGHLVLLSADGGGTFDRASNTVIFPPVPVAAGTSAGSPAGHFTITVEAQGAKEPLTTAELYDPQTGTWTPTAPLAIGRFGHAATLVSTQPCGDECGKVLVTGGVVSTNPVSGTPVYTDSAELYDPSSGTWSPASPARNPRAGHTATELADGTVLVAGGAMVFAGVQGTVTDTAELYDPTTNSWRDTAPMATARGNHTATLLEGPACESASPRSCGTVLVAGGSTAPADAGPTNQTLPATDQAEIYTPFVSATQPTGPQGQEPAAAAAPDAPEPAAAAAPDAPEPAGPGPPAPMLPASSPGVATSTSPPGGHATVMTGAGASPLPMPTLPPLPAARQPPNPVSSPPTAVARYSHPWPWPLTALAWLALVCGFASLGYAMHRLVRKA
ncbi:MAG: kelch repeat-containing protein [Acidimicrobiales bacterium]